MMSLNIFLTRIGDQIPKTSSPDRIVSWHSMKEASISRGELSIRSGGS